METTTQLPQATIDEFVGVSHGDVARVREMLAEHPELATVNAISARQPLSAWQTRWMRC
jgi:hypothetical protein